MFPFWALTSVIVYTVMHGTHLLRRAWFPPALLRSSSEGRHQARQLFSPLQNVSLGAGSFSINPRLRKPHRKRWGPVASWTRGRAGACYLISSPSRPLFICGYTFRAGGIRLRHEGDPHHHPPAQEGPERAPGRRGVGRALHERPRNGLTGLLHHRMMEGRG